jgi:hypothetical protein
MTSNEALVVVGDRFENFLANRRTISASALLWRLGAGDVPQNLSIVVGQGLTAEQLDKLRHLIERANATVSVAGGIPAYSERGLTHKHEPRNVMVSMPMRVADDQFVADLVIDERAAVLDDHLTGQHIPGVALVEAARQTWTAVTEKFLLEGTTKTRFVINTMRSAFHRFVFPLPATVRYQLLARQDSAVQQVFRCLITVHQGDALAAEVEAEYRVIPDVFSRKQESLAARQAVLRQIAQLKQVADNEAIDDNAAIQKTA